jgi:hypothetical protein
MFITTNEETRSSITTKVRFNSTIKPNQIIKSNIMENTEKKSARELLVVVAFVFFTIGFATPLLIFNYHPHQRSINGY